MTTSGKNDVEEVGQLLRQISHSIELAKNEDIDLFKMNDIDSMEIKKMVRSIIEKFYGIKFQAFSISLCYALASQMYQHVKEEDIEHFFDTFKSVTLSAINEIKEVKEKCACQSEELKEGDSK